MKNTKVDNTIRKGRVLKWTFQDHRQAEMIALAQLGQSNMVLKRDTKFGEHEVNYALTKAQKTMNLKGGFRRSWANGESKLCRQIKDDILAVLRADVQRKLPQLILKPEAKTVQ